MGVETFLEQNCLSPELLARGLSLREEEILFVTGPLPGDAGGAESGPEVVLLTDEEGFEDRALRFAPERRSLLLRRRFGVLYQRVGDVDVMVHVLQRATIEGLLDALDAGAIWAGSPAGVDHEAGVELLHRLRRGRALANEEGFERLRERLCAQKLAEWSVHHALARSGDAMAGARTSLEENDPENAYLKLSALYDALGDAVLYSNGQRAGGWQWRLPELRAWGHLPFVDRYLDVKLPRRPPSEPLGAFVERQLEAAGDVVERLRRRTAIPPP